MLCKITLYSFSLSMYISPSLSPPLSFSLSLFLLLSSSFSLSSTYIFKYIYVYIFLSLYLSLSLSSYCFPPLSLSSTYITLYIYMYISFFLSIYLCLSLSLAIPLSFYFSLSLYLTILLSLFFFLSWLLEWRQNDVEWASLNTNIPSLLLFLSITSPPSLSILFLLYFFWMLKLKFDPLLPSFLYTLSYIHTMYFICMYIVYIHMKLLSLTCWYIKGINYHVLIKL